MQNIFERLYKPDVLSCLADLSNDEVFTPPDIANKMLDLLPQDLFKNKETKILDPACKSGVILREAAKRFIEGERDQFDSLQECIDWVFHNQIYGIAITELTSLLSRRSVYCSKYPNSPFSITKFDPDDVQGNILFHRIQHTWEGFGEDKKCALCGASARGYQRDNALETHAYEWIHTLKPEEIFDMKFDVILANPPYQLASGGGSDKKVAATQAVPLYDKFVEQAIKLNPRYITMIIPARWYNGGIGLGKFREHMFQSNHLSVLVDYVNSKDCFAGVDIAGGICYFLWDRSYNGDCAVTNVLGADIPNSTVTRDLNEFGDFFIRSNESISIVHKVRNQCNSFRDSAVYPIDAFGFPSKTRGETTPFDDGVKLVHSQGIGYVGRNDVKKNADIIDKWKVTIGILVPNNGEVGIDPKVGYKSITTPRILKPGEVTTFSYLVIGAFDTEEEAVNYKKYMLCKFTRFMMRLTYSSMHISKNSFILVPDMDFTKEWTDNRLYEYFGLSSSERELIEGTMRTMPYKDFDENGKLVGGDN